MSIKDLIAFYEKKATANDTDNDGLQEYKTDFDKTNAKNASKLKTKEYIPDEHVYSSKGQPISLNDSLLANGDKKQSVRVKDRIHEIDKINSKTETVDEPMQDYTGFEEQMSGEIEEHYDYLQTEEE